MKRIFLALLCLVPMAGLAVQQSPQENTESKPSIILSPEDKAGDRIETLPDVVPQFQGGGLMNFQRWVMMNLCYPAEAMENGIQGRVFVELVVEKDGSVGGIRIVRSPDPLLTAEVMRVLATAPQWTPGQTAGRPVRVRLTLPIDFRMQ